MCGAAARRYSIAASGRTHTSTRSHEPMFSAVSGAFTASASCAKLSTLASVSWPSTSQPAL